MRVIHRTLLLLMLIVLALVLAAPGPSGAQRDDPEWADEVFAAINAERRGAGLLPLYRNPALDQAAYTVLQSKYENCTYQGGGLTGDIAAVADYPSWTDAPPLLDVMTACDAVLTPTRAHDRFIAIRSRSSGMPLELDDAYREVGIAVHEIPDSGTYPLRNYMVVLAAQPNTFPAVLEDNTLYLHDEEAITSPRGDEIVNVEEVRIAGCQEHSPEFQRYNPIVPCTPSAAQIEVVSRGPDRNGTMRESVPAVITLEGVASTEAATLTPTPAITQIPPTATLRPTEALATQSVPPAAASGEPGDGLDGGVPTIPPDARATVDPNYEPRPIRISFFYDSPEHFTIRFYTAEERIWLHGLEFQWRTADGTPQSLRLNSFPELYNPLDNTQPDQCIQLHTGRMDLSVPGCNGDSIIGVALDDPADVFWLADYINFSVWQRDQQIASCSTTTTICDADWSNGPQNREQAVISMFFEWTGPRVMLIVFQTYRPTVDLRPLRIAANLPNSEEQRIYELASFNRLNEQVEVSAFPGDGCIALGNGDPELAAPDDARCASVFFDNRAVPAVAVEPFWDVFYDSFTIRDASRDRLLRECPTTGPPPCIVVWDEAP